MKKRRPQRKKREARMPRYMGGIGRDLRAQQAHLDALKDEGKPDKKLEDKP